jgi:hypothetical protein
MATKKVSPSYNLSSFQKQITSFKNRDLKNVRALGAEALADLFSELYDFMPADEERNLFVNFLNTLPQDLRLVGDSSSGPVSLITQVNLLSLTRQYRSQVANNETDSRKRQATINQLNSLETLIADVYVEQEKQYLSSDGMGNEDASASGTDVEARAREYVSQPSYLPPVGRETAGQNIDPNTGTPILDSNLQFGLPVGEEISYESILRLNPQSSILDLAKLEEEYDLSSDYFDVTDFEEWNSRNRPEAKRPSIYWGQSVFNNQRVPAVSLDRKVTWSAKQAVNYVYQLDEKGDKNKIREIQEMLRGAGYFNPQDGLPLMGLVDDSTIKAWTLFLTDAARSNQSPKDHWLKRVNEMNDVREGRTPIPETEDPLATQNTFQTAAKDILGRNLSVTESRLLSTKMEEWRREVLSFGLSPYDQPVDFEARINNFIEQQGSEELGMERRARLQSSIEKYFGE